MTLRDILLMMPRPLDELGETVERKSRVICSLIALSLRDKVRSVDFWRISIHVNWSDGTEGRVVGGVLMSGAVLDRHRLESTDSSNADLFLLDWTCDAVAAVFRTLELDDALLEEAKAFAKARNFKNYFSGPDIREPGGKRTSRVEIAQGSDVALVTVAISDRAGKTVRLPVAEEHPSELRFQWYLQPLKWIDGSTILLTRADGKEFILQVPPTSVH